MDELDPETEKEIRDAMGKAASSAREDGIIEMARYMRRNYLAFRAQRFTRKQAFTFTMLLYQAILVNG